MTHGHTFCTIEKFNEVARAVAECAFVNSELPVMLSLEMHCNPRNQNRLAKMLVGNLGDTLLKVSLREPRCGGPVRACPVPPAAVCAIPASEMLRYSAAVRGTRQHGARGLTLTS